MVRFFFIIVFLSNQLLALTALELAEHMVDDVSKQNKLRALFDNKNYQDSNGNLDIDKITRTLKINSLIDFALKEPATMRISFKAKTEGILFFKIVNDALNNSGFIYFTPIDLSLRDGNIFYQIEVQSQYILDSGSFYNLLKQNSVFIEDVQKVGAFDYEYTLDFSKAFLKPNVNVPLNEEVVLEKPLRDYIVLLQGAKSIEITSNSMDVWFAKIIFLDQNLNLIRAVQSSTKSDKFKDFIPSGAVYAIIGDIFTLDNIRRGLTIYLKK
ncbi:hypothetical protein [Campylobacter sp. US33a]|uniref:Periplasmic protein n=1 Tax=Campylobacter sp. CCS1377 TaxID=3158229 RepID=A0AAU7E780_9BACT|nr:hypothetical protein [Campylobacter sp. US33a]TEY03075.1 hypothetical protein ELQ16_03775 [Campylobacter sp. US33a]